MRKERKVSKFISYLLRHNPEELEISKDGFVNLHDLVKKIRQRYPWIDEEYVERVARKDKKGRYELAGVKIRARYGHTIDASIDLASADIKKLYHGTTREAMKKILSEGLKPMRRKKVHLSRSVEDAIEVGKRRTKETVVLEIDAKMAIKEGVRIEKASERVYVADYIPKEFISVHTNRRTCRYKDLD